MARVRTSVSLKVEIINQLADIVGKENRKSISNAVETLLEEALKLRKKKKNDR